MTVGLSAVLLGAAVLVLAPIPAAAADVRQDTTVTIGPEQTVNDDLYAFGGSVNVEGTVDGSVIAFGGNITISGTVMRDVMVSGGTIDITGTVKGSVRAAGGNVTISGPVSEDVVIAGGTVTISPGATVGRDLLLAGGNATVAGAVARNIMLGAGEVTLQNQVGGNVTGAVDTLKLNSGARVGGNLDYTSNHEAVLASGASVHGSVTRHTPTSQQFSTTGGFFGWLRSLIGFFALGLLLVLLVAGLTGRVVDTIQRSPLPSAGIGLAVLVVTPIVALLAFIVGILIGGWWLGLLLFPAYFLALAVGYVIAGLWLGGWIANQVGRKVHIIWLLLGGLVVLAIVGLVPILGGLVSFVAAVVGLGALSIAVVNRPPSGPAAPVQAVT